MGIIRTFSNAFRGLWMFITQESNNRIHLGISALVILAGFYFRISQTEWMILILTIGLLLSLEAINFSLEKLCDKIHSGYHEQIKDIKDISAGAVLIAAIVSVVVGLIIFLPRILHLIF